MESESYLFRYSPTVRFRGWGSRGGRETLRRYGVCWFSLLARRRWSRINSEELEAARVIQ